MGGCSAIARSFCVCHILSISGNIVESAEHCMKYVVWFDIYWLDYYSILSWVLGWLECAWFFWFFNIMVPRSKVGACNIVSLAVDCWDFFSCVIIKDRNSPCVPGKIQRSSASLLQLFRVIYGTSVSLGSNAVKLHVWKDENTLKFKYVINFFWAS